MKKTFILLGFFTLFLTTQAQQNVFPTLGNVGIGTNTPTNGNIEIDKDLSDYDNISLIKARKVITNPSTNETNNTIMDISQLRSISENGYGSTLSTALLLRNDFNNAFEVTGTGVGFTPSGGGGQSWSTKIGRNGLNLNVSNGLKLQFGEIQLSGSIIHRRNGVLVENRDAYFASTDDLRFVSNNTERLSVLSSGHITLNPSSFNLNASSSANLNALSYDFKISNIGSALQISDDGTVTIGRAASGASLTTNTAFDYGLYVGKGILAERIRVAVANSSDWADYVFAQDYKLKPLEEVEKFIETNHHLPDVPSAQEMVHSGLDVVKTDALLLRKIEELTLYMIALKKENTHLKNQMNNLLNK